MGVTTCSEKILEPFKSDNFSKTFFHGHSYTANPLACAAAIASLDLLMKPGCKENIARISERHVSFINRISGHPEINQIKSLGTVLSLELKTTGDRSYANNDRKKIYSFFMSRNILLRPLGSVVYVLPPYTISDSELEYIYSCIEEFINLKI